MTTISVEETERTLPSALIPSVPALGDGETLKVDLGASTPAELDRREGEPRPERSETQASEPNVGIEAEPSRSLGGRGKDIEAIVGDVLESAATFTETALEVTATYSERTIDFAAESLAGLLGGASAPTPIFVSPMTQQAAALADRDRDAVRQAEDDRDKRRAQYLSDFDQEIPDEKQHDAEIERSHGRGRAR